MPDNRSLGNFGELRACDYLIKTGYEILDKNFRCRYGEIDIIAKTGDAITFIEVKTRTNELFGLPEESIDIHKIKRIKKASNYYIQQKIFLNMR